MSSSRLLTSERVEFDDVFDAVEYLMEQGWTEGLPVIPPTPDRVAQFLDAVQLVPDHVVGEYAPRSRRLTAEKIAINAVMAGCKPEYMPIVVAACRAITAKEFALNHLATLASAFPLFIVNGPQVNELGFNVGQYVYGPGNRPNATIGRAMSLILANCFDARVGGIQRGTMGHAGRWAFCIAENEDTGWTPLHVQRGFHRTDNVVTAFPSTDPTAAWGVGQTLSAEQAAAILTMAIIRSSTPTLTYYLFTVSPPWVEFFENDGWSKDDVKAYIVEHALVSVADLKIWGRWQYFGTQDGRLPKIEPGDDRRMVNVFKRDQYRHELWQDAELDREPDLLFVAAGGDAGSTAAMVPSYNVGTRPVSVAVATGLKGAA